MRRDPSGRGWIADVSIDGRRKTARASTKAEAETRRRGLLQALLDGPPASRPRPAAAFTLADARRLSLQVRWAGKAYERTAAIFSRAVLDGLGEDLGVEEVTPPMVIAWRQKLLDGGNTPSTVNKKVSALAAMLRDAVNCGHLASMPSLPQQLSPGGHRDRVFQPEETAMLCRWFEQAGHPAAADLLVFLLETAARWGEAERLRGRDINLEGRKCTFWRTKNGDPRTIPLTRRAVDALERNMPPKETHRIWPYSYLQYNRLFNKAIASAGLGDSGLTVHITRHTAATRMAEGGVSQAQLMAYGGWRSLAAVQRYMHVQTERLADCVKALEG